LYAVFEEHLRNRHNRPDARPRPRWPAQDIYAGKIQLQLMRDEFAGRWQPARGLYRRLRLFFRVIACFDFAWLRET
jgi:hypothetical protein